MPEYVGLEYLRGLLRSKRQRIDTRYRYYDMKKDVEKMIDSVIPERYWWMRPVSGWCAKAVDSLADRIVFDKFYHDDFGLNEIYSMNSRDVLCDDAVLSALITSCSFIYISADDDGYPRMQVIDGGNATGIIEPITHMLKEGYAVLERDPKDNNTPTIEAYFTPQSTTYYYKGQRNVQIIANPAPYPLLVPIINRPDSVRPFGHSRISRACMSLTQQAMRTLLRSEVSAEFYSFPQKYVLGLSEEAAEMEKWKATMSSFLDFRQDESGNKPSVGQFQQQSMTPYMEQLRAFAAMFAGETGLTLDDLGFATQNPATEEAIKAAHENLKLTARKAQRTFGTGFLNAGYLAACLRDRVAYQRYAFRDTTATFKPIFEPDASTLSGVGDAILKINQAAPGYLGNENIRRLTGMEGDFDINKLELSAITETHPPLEEETAQTVENAKEEARAILNGNV